MQTQYDIEQIADRLTSQLFDSSIHNRQGFTKDDIRELAEDYMDDEEIICDVVLDGSFIDQNQFWATLKAMVNAHSLGDELSMMTFAKSMSIEVMCAVEKRAEWELTK